MKILFIDPPFHRFMHFYRFYYPVGLASMSAILNKEGHEVVVYDADHERDMVSMSWPEATMLYDEYPNALKNPKHPVWLEVKKVLMEIKPDIIGISILTPKASSALYIAELCKKYNSDVPVIVGGDHATVFPEYFLKNRNIDYVVRGEGEATIVDLIECIESGDLEDLSGIQGISYCDSSYIHNNSDREPIMNLDAMPFPDIKSIMHFETYRPVDFGVIIGSRGCPYSCTFCGVATVWTKKMRYRSPENILAEIKYLYKEYGTKYFSFRDASFTLRKKSVTELCRLIEESGLDIEWECLTRADLLDDRLIETMKNAGCDTIRLGVESGSPEMLKYMKKSASLDAIRRAAKHLNKVNMYWSAYFLFGTPRETLATIELTLDFIEEIDPPYISMARYAPIPGTTMYLELEEKGLISRDIDWSMEGNQRFSSHYVYDINAETFEQRMHEVSAFIEDHNTRKSIEFGREDQRLK